MQGIGLVNRLSKLDSSEYVMDFKVTKHVFSIEGICDVANISTSVINQCHDRNLQIYWEP